LLILITLGEKYKLWSSSFCNFSILLLFRPVKSKYKGKVVPILN
jgi:hypothetical protein